MASNPICYLRFLNAVPDPAADSAIDIYVNGYPVTRNLKYRSFTEYHYAAQGIYNVKVFRAGGFDKELYNENVDYHEKVIYTMAFTGAPDRIEPALITDRKRSSAADYSYIRFVNLAPFDTVYSIFLNNKAVISGLEYKDTSDYMRFPPGKYYFSAKDRRGKTVLQDPNLRLSPGKYTAGEIVGETGSRLGLQILVPLEGTTYLKF